MDIIFKGRHTDVLDRFRKHATSKLAKVEKLDHKAIMVEVEVTAERNPRQSGTKERVELTITTRGPAIRAEAAAEDRFAALDLALAKLESRLRRACDRRKDRHAARPETAEQSSPRADADLAGAAAPSPAEPAGAVPMSRPAPEDDLIAAGSSLGSGNGGSAAAGSRPGEAMDFEADGDDEVVEEKIIAIEMQGGGPLVVREKVHIACPMTIDQALFEMELVGHDFFLFTDTTDGLPSVVYRRRGYQYGVIRLVEEAAAALAAHGPGLANGRPRQAANLANG
jgi:ribosomal subunit interface protein